MKQLRCVPRHFVWHTQSELGFDIPRTSRPPPPFKNLSITRTVPASPRHPRAY
ncbi:hypothetical protein BV22DRAFT_1029975 [Leucogyrophana mollusca]|uniref:Uncharacterized protein n=1 Tax=Leucogyrophana mollusca TaxID=85980 RepID=A0ACB8BVT9_9AGAM|nr:hypothetical protein BV22DRAFT_1029975 [Leucogyrophana mollusca]